MPAPHWWHPSTNGSEPGSTGSTYATGDGPTPIGPGFFPPQHRDTICCVVGTPALVRVGPLGGRQLLARLSYSESSDHPTMDALGTTRRQRFALAMARVLTIAAAGAVLAVC